MFFLAFVSGLLCHSLVPLRFVSCLLLSSYLLAASIGATCWVERGTTPAKPKPFFFFLRHLFHRHWSHGQIPCLRGRRLGWGGVVSSRFGEEIEKRGRVAVGVVGGAQG